LRELQGRALDLRAFTPARAAKRNDEGLPAAGSPPRIGAGSAPDPTAGASFAHSRRRTRIDALAWHAPWFAAIRRDIIERAEASLMQFLQRSSG